MYPGEEFRSKGHPEKTVELLSVTEGMLALEVEGVGCLVASNHRAIAMTDRPHAYRCNGTKRTRFCMVVHEPAQSERRRGQ